MPKASCSCRCGICANRNGAKVNKTPAVMDANRSPVRSKASMNVEIPVRAKPKNSTELKSAMGLSVMVAIGAAKRAAVIRFSE